MPFIRNWDKPTAVYRAFDDSGSLLYVGMTFHPKARFRQHEQKSEWWHEKNDLTVEHYENRWDAEASEAAAILGEKPRHNKGSSSYDHRPWITSRRDFPLALPVTSTPAPARAARAIRTQSGMLAVRHRSYRRQDRAVVGISTAWAIPKAWDSRKIMEVDRRVIRPADDDEAELLLTAPGTALSSREHVFARYGRPWFVEDVAVMSAHEARLA